MPGDLHFAPNVPVLVSLIDPEGAWDSELRVGHYQTTSGQSFTLPRPAVILLNSLEPKPGEEIQITRHWKGRPKDPFEWTVGLSARSEQLRAAQETVQLEAESHSELAVSLERSIARTRQTQALKPPPTLVKRPPGTERTGAIPWNVAFREVSRWVSAELAANQLQWSDGAQQDLCSTVLIAAVKAGHIGLWERNAQ